jgi:hypothetical protein
MEAFVHYLKVRGRDWGHKLSLRLDQYKEERHYAFVEYSGANLTHFSFEDQDSQAGQGQISPDPETNVPSLCAKAIVIADGDIVTKSDRKERFLTQLQDRFVCLPCKEIENFIPEALMKMQIQDDHKPPKKGNLEQSAMDKIAYVNYARSDHGIGKYLGDLGIKKYIGTIGNSGSFETLPTYYKSRWRNEDFGIPKRIRTIINSSGSASNKDHQIVSSATSPNAVDSTLSDHLPDYLTWDLLWLCLLIYRHISRCNFDNDTLSKLDEIKEHIHSHIRNKESVSLNTTVSGEENNDSNQCVSETDINSDDATKSWPISVEVADSRDCLLKNFAE